MSLKHSQTSEVELFFAKIVFRKKLHLRLLTEFWMYLCNVWFICKMMYFFNMSDRVVVTGDHDSSPILNLYFCHSRFQENLLVCHCRRYPIARPSSYIILSGILMSIQSGQKIKHKKITWSQHCSILVFLLKKRGQNIDIDPGGIF